VERFVFRSREKIFYSAFLKFYRISFYENVRFYRISFDENVHDLSTYKIAIIDFTALVTKLVTAQSFTVDTATLPQRRQLQRALGLAMLSFGRFDFLITVAAEVILLTNPFDTTVRFAREAVDEPVAIFAIAILLVVDAHFDWAPFGGSQTWSHPRRAAIFAEIVLAILATLRKVVAAIHLVVVHKFLFIMFIAALVSEFAVFLRTEEMATRGCDFNVSIRHGRWSVYW
jgi:hypothetical protein